MSTKGYALMQTMNGSTWPIKVYLNQQKAVDEGLKKQETSKRVEERYPDSKDFHAEYAICPVEIDMEL